MYEFRHVRIPADLLTEAEEIGEALRALPEHAEMGNGKGRTTATIHLAITRGFAALRAEIANRPKAKRPPVRKS